MSNDDIATKPSTKPSAAFVISQGIGIALIILAIAIGFKSCSTNCLSTCGDAGVKSSNILYCECRE